MSCGSEVRRMRERFISNKYLIMHYYLVMAVLATLFWWLGKDNESMDAVITTILALYILLFPVVILYTRKYAVHIFLFVLAFITGFYSFYYYSIDEHSILNALYFTFQLYLLDITDVFTTDGSSLLHYPFIVEIARWSAALYTISTLFIAMYRLLEMSILLIFYQIVGNHYVVFGYHENCLALLEDLRDKRRRVILVASNLSHEEIDYLESLKIVVLNNNENEEYIHTKCALDRAANVILFHTKDMDNLNNLMGIHYFFQRSRKTNDDLYVYIHLQGTETRRLYQEMEAESERLFHVQIVNLYELFVDTLFEKYPLYKVPETSAHILLIGFGSMGQQIALKAVSESESIQNHTVQITVLDKYMKKIKRNWQRNNPHVDRQAELSLLSFDVESDNVIRFIQAQKTPITHIYVCLHEDNLDLLAGMELSNHFPHIPIFIEYSEDSIAEKWIQSRISGTRLIYSTGTLNQILNEENFLKRHPL